MRKIQFASEIDNTQAQKDLDRLNKSIERTEKQLQGAQDKKSGIEKSLEAASEKAEQTREKVKALQAELAAEQKRGADSMLGGTKTLQTYESEALQEQIAAKLKEQQDLLKGQAKEAEKLDREYWKADEKVKNITRDLAGQQAAAGKLERQIAETFDPTKLKAAGQQMTSTLQGGVKTVLKYVFGIRSLYILVRKLRSVITAGIKEMAQYDSKTRDSLNNIKDSVNTWKASLTSAAAPILQAIEPVIVRLINLLTDATNKVGMLFAALAGKKTYTKAIAKQNTVTSAIEATTEAAKEARKYLSGLDEVTTYTEQSTDKNDKNKQADDSGFLTGTEEVEIPASYQKIAGWLADHLKELKIAALAVGAAILGWKLSKLFTLDLTKVKDAFKALLTFIGKNWKMITGLSFAIIGLIEFIKAFADALNNGIDWQNFIAMVGAAALVVGGLTLAFNATVGAVALLILGIAMLVAGIMDWVKTGELSDAAAATIIAGITAIGIAIALLTHSFIPLIIAAILVVILAIYKNWDTIKEFAGKVWDAIKAWFGQLADSVKDLFQRGKTALDEFWNTVKQKVTNKLNEIKNSVKTKFEEIKSTLSGIIERIKGLFNFSWSFPKPKMPHFSVNWEDWGVLTVPRVSVDWYAHGGIVDKASLIGAGEDGKEAIIPLERHTEWIRLVAENLADLLDDHIADLMSTIPLPAVATGTVIPPRITVEAVGLDELRGDIQRLADAVLRQRGGDYRFTAQLNRRTIFDEMIDEARLRRSATGDNPFNLR